MCVWTLTWPLPFSICGERLGPHVRPGNGSSRDGRQKAGQRLPCRLVGEQKLQGGQCYFRFNTSLPFKSPHLNRHHTCLHKEFILHIALY